MKKIFTLAAAASMVLVANAGTKVLYNQDFESVTSGAETGWTFGGASIDIVSDEFGQFLQLNQGGNNGRNGQVSWGDQIFGENGSELEDGIYTVTFDYYPKQNSNNQYNSGITVLSNLTPPANQPFLGRWTYLKDAEGNNIEDMSLYQGYLFDLLQIQRETEDLNSIQFSVNGDANDLITLNNAWYTVTLVVDVNNRTVEYSIDDLIGANITAGVRNVPATECDGTEISMYATGMWVMVARYYTFFGFDNIKVTCESSQDVANVPSVALTRIGKDAEGELDLAHRAYTITFIEGETLHVIGTDGVEETVSYDDCDGNYEYTTTTSGHLSAWTTSGNATSEIVEVDVDCSPVVLPVASADILSVTPGYGKTYRLTVSNADVPLTPTIFISYKYVGDEGEIIEAAEQGTGTSFTVTQPGKLTVTTAAFGYKENTVEITNSIPYAQKYSLDLAHLTTDEIKAAGFAAIDDLNSGATSGENNWTARKRLFYYDAASAHVDEESGETVYDPVYPFGFIAEDDTEHLIHRWLISAEDINEEIATNLFDGLTTWNDLAVQILQGIGLTQNATTRNYNTVKIHNCGENDIIVFNYINNYGGNSNHPICNSDAEYFAQLCGEDVAYPVAALGEEELGAKAAGAYRIPEENGTYTVGWQLYRIDTALNKVTVFAAGEDGISNVVVDDLKAVDNAWYTIDGIRMDAPAQNGLYIHQGKKVYIRK